MFSKKFIREKTFCWNRYALSTCINLKGIKKISLIELHYEIAIGMPIEFPMSTVAPLVSSRPGVSKTNYFSLYSKTLISSVYD